MGRVVTVMLAAVLGLWHQVSAAAETIKDPLAYPVRHHLAVLGMTMLGGFAGWYVKVRKGESKVSVFALIGEMAVSSLAGFGAFFICDWLGGPIGVAAAIAGMTGYMGGRALEAAEKSLLARAEKALK
jgi:hypothetical protein